MDAFRTCDLSGHDLKFQNQYQLKFRPSLINISLCTYILLFQRCKYVASFAENYEGSRINATGMIRLNCFAKFLKIQLQKSHKYLHLNKII